MVNALAQKIHKRYRRDVVEGHPPLQLAPERGWLMIRVALGVCICPAAPLYLFVLSDKIQVFF
ncbi:hypothetical protein GCM10011297_34390 [Bacterioplanes sanyensis]|nr:hypothetical protein GCM10011297_34390 [Bacterioplanes sanyensis]